MGVSTSTRLTPWNAELRPIGITGVLVGPFFGSLQVSDMDTFIEKPFSVLSFHVCQLCKTSAKTTAAPLKSKAIPCEQYARTREESMS